MNRALPPAPPKGRKRTENERRVDATNATKGKFGGKAFSMRRGRDCARMALFHLREVGRPIPVAAAGTWSNAKEARASLARMKVSSFPELLDQHLARVSFAAIQVGDIIQLEAEPGALSDVGAVSIWAGNGTAFGYHEDATGPVMMILLDPPVAVWTVL